MKVSCLDNRHHHLHPPDMRKELPSTVNFGARGLEIARVTESPRKMDKENCHADENPIGTPRPTLSGYQIDSSHFATHHDNRQFTKYERHAERNAASDIPSRTDLDEVGMGSRRTWNCVIMHARLLIAGEINLFSAIDSLLLHLFWKITNRPRLWETRMAHE